MIRRLFTKAVCWPIYKICVISMIFCFQSILPDVIYTAQYVITNRKILKVWNVDIQRIYKYKGLPTQVFALNTKCYAIPDRNDLLKEIKYNESFEFIIVLKLHGNKDNICKEYVVIKIWNIYWIELKSKGQIGLRVYITL